VRPLAIDGGCGACIAQRKNFRLRSAGCSAHARAQRKKTLSKVEQMLSCGSIKARVVCKGVPHGQTNRDRAVQSYDF
jgi:hypothetical protein